MEPLFAPLPEDLSDESKVSDEALSEALTARLEAIDKIEAEDAEFVGDRSAAEVLAEMTSGVEQIEAIRAEIKSREEAAEEYAASKADLAARAKGDEAEPEAEAVEDAEALAAEAEEPKPEGDDEDGAKDESPSPELTVTAEVVVEEAKPAEPVVADGSSFTPAPKPRVHRRPPRASADRQPLPSNDSAGQLIASAGIRGITPGTPLDRKALGKALYETHRTTGTSASKVREHVVVASAKVDYPADRVLGDNPEENAERIEAVTKALSEVGNGPDALTAAGGICAPLTPLYDLPILSVADRPVRAALAGFQATRGGISVPTPLSLASVAEGVGVVTAADDALGGTFATKECVVIDCDPFTDAEIEAIYACIQHGNFGARTWPERVANLGDLLAAQHAKVAEIELLDAIGAGSTAVTEAAVYGATSSILQAVLVASAAMRSRHRMRPETRLRAIFPAWAIDLMVADMVHTPYDRFERTRDGVTALLSTIGGVSASWYLDGETGAGQIFGAQEAGALLEFPDTVVWYLFPEGTWLFLDGGELDLGLVRDSVLNATNDFQIFMETFEGAAKVGIESLKITSTVCPDGTYAPANTKITC